MLLVDGAVYWIARADRAEEAVAVLTQADPFDGISPPVTSSQALDFADIAKIASEILGRDIARETVSDEDYGWALMSHGLHTEMADGIGSFYEAARAHEFAVVDPTLERPLSRSPTAIKDVLNHFLSS